MFDSTSLFSSTRPDLEEFLSALGGFLDKKTAPGDSSYLRFLEIFCRSVGAGEGHLLRARSEAGLQSDISFGIGDNFDRDFNTAHAAASAAPCPLDEAFRQKRVVAIVDLEKAEGLPPWFMNLMRKYRFQSLVAVPLLGQQNPVGILCAYYHDVCLFDQGTLDHLMMIGRMVGGATEKSSQDVAVASPAVDKSTDEFLLDLTSKPFTKIQMFDALTRAIASSVEVGGLVAGPVQKTNDGLAMVVAAGSGVPAAVLSRRFILPAFLEKLLLQGWAQTGSSPVRRDQWGSLKPLIHGNSLRTVSASMIVQNKIHGAIVGWRHTETPFTEADRVLLERLSRIASVALPAAMK